MNDTQPSAQNHSNKATRMKKQNLWRVAATILLIVAAGFSTFAFISSGRIAEQNSRLMVKIQDLNQDMSALKAALEQQGRDNTQTLTQMQVTLQEHKDRLAGLQDQLRQTHEQIGQLQEKGLVLNRLQETLNDQTERLSGLSRKIEFSLKILGDQKAQPSDSKIFHLPKPLAYYKSGEWKEKVERFLAALPPGASRSIDGRGGTDTVNLDKGGNDLSIDSVFIKSIEIYTLRNNMADTVTIDAPGLVDLENNALEIHGDADLDKVTLDGCLKWKPLSDESDLAVWKAIDTSGETRTVRITKGVPTTIATSCDNRYLETEQRNIAARMWSGDTSPTPAFNTQAAPVMDADVIGRYERWLNGILHPSARSDLALLIRLMKEGKLPTKFPRWDMQSGNQKKFRFEPLSFDPNALSVYSPEQKIDCVPGNGEKPAMIIHNDGGSQIRCSYGNQLYFLGDGQDNIDDSWGDDIFSTGAGNDDIDAHWGQDIFIFKRGWGKETIGKTCSAATIGADAEFELTPPPMPVFSGVGISFQKNSNGLYIVGILPNGPAAKSGLRTGDLIINIDGQAVLGMSSMEASGKMKGGRGTTVTLDYKPAGNMGGTRTVILVREIIDLGKASMIVTPGQHISSYGWHYPYNNFIVFAPGIRESDMYWDGDRLINRSTGDEIAFKADSRCFNFVYSDDNRQAIPLQAVRSVNIPIIPPPREKPQSTLPAGFDQITFQRTPCYGSCPVYKIIVSGDGHVDYMGAGNVKTTGMADGALSREQLSDLTTALNAADYFSIPVDAMCRTMSSDLPGVVTSVTMGGQTHEINDFAGCNRDPSGRLLRFENAIERIVNVTQWTGSLLPQMPQKNVTNPK